MKKLLKFSCIIAFIFSSTLSIAQKNGNEINHISSDFYELYKPDTTEVVLMLFGGYPENAEDIEREFAINDLANKKSIAVAYLNYSRKLWLEENEKRELAESIQDLLISNNLPTKRIFFGGFSSGGNMALLISDFLTGNSKYNIKPKGVFIVDSPLDLLELYHTSEKNIKNNFSEDAVAESTWILETFNNKFGDPIENLKAYEKYSVSTLSTKNIKNINALNETKLRFYTEPDTLWWKENKMADYEDLNAYHIKVLSENLQQNGFKNSEYIPSKIKGHRSNGVRHPHSWSIVDKGELLKWMLEE